MNAPFATDTTVSALERTREGVHDMYKQLKKNKASLAEAKNTIQTAQSVFETTGSVLHSHPVELFWEWGPLRIRVTELQDLVDKVKERVERSKRRQWRERTRLVSL
jgi:hypothetical protein